MKTLATLLTGALILMSVTSQAQGRVWRVNNQGYSAHFTGLNALQDAIDSEDVGPGDTLHLEASPSSYGFITLNKRLVIIGPGYFLNENVIPTPLQHHMNSCWVNRFTFTNNSRGSTITGISQVYGDVTGTGTIIDADSITIDRCYLMYITLNCTVTRHAITIKRNFVLLGIDGAGTLVNLMLLNNRFSAINLPATHQGTVAHNAIWDNGANFHPSIDFHDNIVRAGTIVPNLNSISNVHHNIVHDSPMWLSGSTNHLNMPPASVFISTSTTDGNLRTLPFCTVCNTGGTAGGAIGMFGGATPYTASGIPGIPSIYELTTPANATQGQDLPVTLSTRSNN